MIQINCVRSEDDAKTVRTLVWEFIDWLYERYPDHVDMVDEYLRTQKLEEQLENLLVVFNPPQGECLLARLSGAPAGIVMLKPRPDGACEMNRMYVRPAARGHGVGVALGQRLIEVARALGYPRMILTAGIHHHEAIPLYRKLGFVEDDSIPDTGAGDLEVRMALAL